MLTDDSSPRRRRAALARRLRPATRGTALLFPLVAITGGALLGIFWGAVPTDWGWTAVVVAGGLAIGQRVSVAVTRASSRRKRTGEGSAAAGAGLWDVPGFERAVCLQTLNDLGVALLLTDPVGTVVHATKGACEVLQTEAPPRVALDLSGTFFGLSVDDPGALATLHRFFGSEDASGEGVVECTGARRQIHWMGKLLTAADGSPVGRAFVLRDSRAEHHLESIRTDFLGTMSHELRTPLTSLRGSLELVLTRAEGLSSADRELLQISVKNTERLIRLTNDLLDVDRLERGAMAFEFTTVDVQALVAAAVKATAGACAARELKVQIDVTEEIPPVHGDFERLLQVLVNLLDNTCRYAPPGSPVVIRIRQRDAGVQIDVCDRGPGIASAEQAYVFDRFWRADRPHGDAGTGLGLAICRSIIHGHGGHIWLDSEEGHGAIFSVALPRSVFRTQPEDSEAVAFGPANPVVLVIEDDPDTRAVTRASLELHGYLILEAGYGVQGVNIARREQPDIILLDLALPDLDGYDVLRVLKNDPATQAIPVVVLSVAPTLEQAHQLGAADVLQKPARFEAVRWMLARALRRKHQPEGRLVVGMAPAVSKDLSVLAQVLEQETHGIYRGRDLQDLAAWSAAHYPDILVLDEDVLPESRSEAAELLRHPVTGAPVPLIFLGDGTGNPGDGSAWVGVAKPVSKEEFLALAKRVITPVSQR